MTSFYLNYLFKKLISKYGDILRCCRLGLQHMNLVGVGDTLQPIIDAFLQQKCWHVSRAKPTVMKEF